MEVVRIWMSQQWHRLFSARYPDRSALVYRLVHRHPVPNPMTAMGIIIDGALLMQLDMDVSTRGAGHRSDQSSHS